MPNRLRYPSKETIAFYQKAARIVASARTPVAQDEELKSLFVIVAQALKALGMSFKNVKRLLKPEGHRIVSQVFEHTRPENVIVQLKDHFSYPTTISQEEYRSIYEKLALIKLTETEHITAIQVQKVLRPLELNEPRPNWEQTPPRQSREP